MSAEGARRRARARRRSVGQLEKEPLSLSVCRRFWSSVVLHVRGGTGVTSGGQTARTQLNRKERAACGFSRLLACSPRCCLRAYVRAVRTHRVADHNVMGYRCRSCAASTGETLRRLAAADAAHRQTAEGRGDTRGESNPADEASACVGVAVRRVKVPASQTRAVRRSGDRRNRLQYKRGDNGVRRMKRVAAASGGASAQTCGGQHLQPQRSHTVHAGSWCKHTSTRTHTHTRGVREGASNGSGPSCAARVVVAHSSLSSSRFHSASVGDPQGGRCRRHVMRGG